MSIKKKKFSYYIEKAYEVALMSPMHQRHGCIIVLDDEIISKGYNFDFQQKTFHGYWSFHAEANAIVQACHLWKNGSKVDLSRAAIIVVRISRYDGSLVDSKPCSDCAAMILKYKIPTVYYSTNVKNVISKTEYVSTDNILDYCVFNHKHKIRN